MAKGLIIAGLLLMAALDLSRLSFSPAQPISHSDSAACCCTDDNAVLPLASCGCRSCPATTAGQPLIADFTKVLLPIPEFQTICWKSFATHAEPRSLQPPTPPPRIPA